MDQTSPEGVEEEAAVFSQSVNLTDRTRFRRIAGIGPVYEVISITGDRALTRVVDADDAFDFDLVEVESDPVA